MTQITKSYAEALFALALETDSAAAFSDGLKLTAAMLKDNPEYEEFLSCYGIPAKERTNAIEQAFGSYLPEHILSFVQLLCERGLITRLHDCAAEYETLYREAQRMSTVKVTSAVPLSEAQRQKLETSLVHICKRRVMPVYTVDPAILGGIIVEADGKVLDGSVRHQLQEVKEVIKQ